MTKTMTTIEVLTMALQIAEAAHTTGARPEITISGPRTVMQPGRICILVTPAFNTGDHDTGELLLAGTGNTIDDAAADMLPRLREAAALVALRLEKQRECDASRLRSIEAATAGAA